MIKLKNQIINSIYTVTSNLSYPKKECSLAPPKNTEFGDLCSNIALLLAKDLKKFPLEIANNIVGELNNISNEHITSISVTNPGFINFKIEDHYFQSEIKNILNESQNYGRGSTGVGKTANVEFVSANPTGPLTVGHGRNAILGDTVSNILEWQGYKVTREYYFNNAGRQMRILAQSVEARYFELLGQDLELPQDGYQGQYIINIARSILNQKGQRLKSGDPIFKSIAEDTMFDKIKYSLKELKIHFDQFTNEKTFYENGDIEKFMDELKGKDLIYEKENATWFRTTSLGKKQDRVYIKSTGEPTYRVPDTAYHRDKINRNYDLIIDVFGADHADAYPDVICALEALGHDTSHIKVLIYQFVTLLRDGEKVKMSTRKADFVSLDDLIDQVGIDVVRYFFIMRSMNSHLDFDLDLASDQSDKNPVYYLQYAHARICNIISRANNLDLPMNGQFDPSYLIHDDELHLLKHMVRFQEYINIAYENFEPQNIANYLQELSARFHKFYSHCRVITEDIELSKSRLALVKATKIILANGFKILGISAPKRM
tara:strand:- start:1393 stop:3027 length:1635 start_codon:yes stop_codon:yes gene_type:complete